ncbi:MAG: transglutaminase family protein [Verrucomicrobiae bacterium]|nr:transglutaminase family protein [Verrucomicrobiae bacterium]
MTHPSFSNETGKAPELVRYRIDHLTAYDYSQNVSISHHVARLRPISGNGQKLIDFRLTSNPAPTQLESDSDYFGNAVERFSIQEPHDRLEVVAFSEVEVSAAIPIVEGIGPAWEQVRASLAKDRSPTGLAAYECSFPSDMIPVGPEFADYAAASFSAERPVLEAALALTLQIHGDFKFDPTATTVATPVSEVLAKRRGVCQDFAHLQIACLRSLGIPARYVSGYVRTDPPPGQKRLVGVDATHAWVSVYCPGIGWVEFDPTNKRIAGDTHVRVAYGRDFGDVSPLRGTVIGGGWQQLSIAVTVQPTDELEVPAPVPSQSQVMSQSQGGGQSQTSMSQNQNS